MVMPMDPDPVEMALFDIALLWTLHRVTESTMPRLLSGHCFWHFVRNVSEATRALRAWTFMRTSAGCGLRLFEAGLPTTMYCSSRNDVMRCSPPLELVLLLLLFMSKSFQRFKENYNFVLILLLLINLSFNVCRPKTKSSRI